MEIGIGEILTAGATIVLAFITGWKTVKSQPNQDRLTDAQAAAKYEEVAAHAAERNQVLYSRVIVLQDKVDVIDNDLAKVTRVMEDWEIGINVLIDQLCEEGLDPRWRPEPSKLAE